MCWTRKAQSVYRFGKVQLLSWPGKVRFGLAVLGRLLRVCGRLALGDLRGAESLQSVGLAGVTVTESRGVGGQTPPGDHLAQSVAAFELDVSPQRVRKVERVPASWADVVVALWKQTDKVLKRWTSTRMYIRVKEKIEHVRRRNSSLVVCWVRCPA